MKQIRCKAAAVILAAVCVMGTAPVYAEEEAEVSVVREIAGQEVMSGAEDAQARMEAAGGYGQEVMAGDVQETIAEEEELIWMDEEGSGGEQTPDPEAGGEQAPDPDEEGSGGEQGPDTETGGEQTPDTEEEETDGGQPPVTGAVGGQAPDTETDGEQALETEEEDPDGEQALDPEKTPHISYCTHVQTYGWQEYVRDGEVSGTSGESKRLEGIRIRVDGAEDLGVEYCTHVQTYGWQDYSADDGLAGTTGESKRLEAIRIRLTGSSAEQYDVWYCVHVQTYGWLNWAKNDEMAGTAGYSKRLEGICIQILPKESPAPVSLSGAVSSFVDSAGGSSIGPNAFSVVYNTHVETYGWREWVGDGSPAGTSGESKRLEGMHVLLQNQDEEGGIEYRTHVQGIGWQEWVSDGALAGTTGESRRLEALQIRLTGAMSEKYDVWYRTHCQSFGWMGWTKNGEQSGTQGYGYRMEAMEICLLPKGSKAPGSTDMSFAGSRKTGGRTIYGANGSKGKLIALDPGHAMHIPAGSEPNAPGSGAMKMKDTYGTYGFASGLAEYELCLQVALKLRDALVARGYSVVLTRETNDTAISCIERTQVANEAGADAYIRIHANGGGGPGAITMCTTEKNPHTKDVYEKSRLLSEILLETYCKVTGRRSQGVVYTDDLTGNNWAEMPTTLIEMGYMTVPEEDLWMASSEGQKLIVKGIADGLDAYYASFKNNETKS